MKSSVPFLIARRFLTAAKGWDMVQIISRVAIMGIIVSTAALLVVLSVFQGLDNMYSTLTRPLDPQLEVTAKVGKYLPDDQDIYTQIMNVAEVKSVTPCLEEKAFLKFKDNSLPVVLKGVTSNYTDVNPLDSFITTGRMVAQNSTIPEIVLGNGVSYNLGLGLNDSENSLSLFVPQATENIQELRNTLKVEYIEPVGIFNVDREINEQLTFVTLPYLQKLLNKKGVSSYEIALNTGADDIKAKKELLSILGDKVVIKTRKEQQAVFYRMLNIEYNATYLMFVIILGISMFTLASTITMLVISKQSDLKTFTALGMPVKDIRGIFQWYGAFITIVGTVVGIILAIILIFAQRKWGIIMVKNAFMPYPVVFKWQDATLVFCTVLLLGFVFTWFSVRKLKKA